MQLIILSLQTQQTKKALKTLKRVNKVECYAFIYLFILFYLFYTIKIIFCMYFLLYTASGGSFVGKSKVNLPLSKVKSIIKSDPDVALTGSDTVYVMTKVS